VTSSRLILASSSPRRQKLLREAGYEFTVVPSNVDESAVPATLGPGDLAEYLGRLKAQTVAAQFPQDVVLGADTVVEFAGHILGKPADAADAARMLRLLSGTTHSVITGIAVFRAGDGLSLHARVLSPVQMRKLMEREIEDYVAGGQWQGKAGGYGIQDPDPFVVSVSGCHTNIVGLPMTTTSQLLEQAGIRPKTR